MLWLTLRLRLGRKLGGHRNDRLGIAEQGFNLWLEIFENRAN